MKDKPTTSKIGYTDAIIRSYDPETKSLKTTPSASTQFSIELDHKDGDSVYSVPMHKHLKGEGELDVSDCRFVWVYGPGVSISPHPEDDVWVNLSSGKHEIAACRIKSDSSESYVVARS